MLRTYEFYQDVLGIYPYEVNKITAIIENVENGIYNEDEIRSLGANGLKFCICEGKYDVFKKLVGPFEYQDGEKTRYRYLLEPVSLGIIEYINNLPGSIMEHWATVNKNGKMNAEFAGEEFFPLPVEYTSRNAVVMYSSLKKELIEAILKVDKAKIMTIKIKDVLAKQICGTGFPIRSIRDVCYYAELPLLFPCIDLFKKNIITISNDTGGCYDDCVTDDTEVFKTNLIINYESLDEFNKVVADALIESGAAHIFENPCSGETIKELIVEVPCKRNESVYQVTKRMMELVSKFNKQDMVYGQLNEEDFYNMFCNWFSMLSDEDASKVNAILEQGYSNENILKVLEYFPFLSVYYDKEEGKFWSAEYYYKKHREYVEDNLEFGSQGLK